MTRVANIGPHGELQRLRLGIMAVAAAFLLGALIFALGVPRAWRLTLFIPLWIAGLGFFQARAKT